MISDAKMDRIEDYLLQLTQDVATVKAKLEIIDEIKDSMADVNTLKADTELLRQTVTLIEKRITRLEDKLAEEAKYKSRSFFKIVLTIIATIVSGLILEQLI